MSWSLINICNKLISGSFKYNLTILVLSLVFVALILAEYVKLTSLSKLVKENKLKTNHNYFLGYQSLN